MHCSSFDLSLLILFSVNGVVSYACWIVIRWREKMTMFPSLDNLYFLKNLAFSTPGTCVKEGIKLSDAKGNFTNPGGYEGYPNDTKCM